MLTVLIATHNGAGTLPQVLDAYLGLTTPAGPWRLVIIDNASSDNTTEVVKRFSDRLPLVPVRTEERGKNLALNRGLTLIEGDLVVFTDDDAVPDRNWLLALEAASLAQPAYDIFGGRIVPAWPESCPTWIPRLVNLCAAYGITPAGMTEGPIPAAAVWGANMAVRHKVFSAGHRFNELVGPKAGHYIMGSEVDFNSRMEELGHKAWFVSGATVAHIIRPHQLERRWLIQRAFRLGRHMYYREAPTFSGTKGLIRGAPRWQYRKLLDAYAARLRAIMLLDSEQRFQADWEISYYRGYLGEAGRTRARS